MSAIEPDEQTLSELAAIAGGPDDGEFVMLNLNRYRDRDRYQLYAAVAAQVLGDVGGSIAWYSPAVGTVVGQPGERWDEVIAVRYPSVAAFLKLATDPRIAEVREDRAAGLERATLVRCTAAPAPVSV
jgi:uncharacterized protein (DUF1330 family)